MTKSAPLRGTGCPSLSPVDRGAANGPVDGATPLGAAIDHFGARAA